MDDQKAGDFIPQKEFIYTRFLPYADKIQEEAEAFLIEIKTNLGLAIQCQNLHDISLWTQQMERYISLYSLRFSKEDHVNFIKIYYELLITPDLELMFVLKIISLLIKLLKKIELLSREDLSLPWKPLYELYERIFYTHTDKYGMVLVPENFDQQLRSLIKHCNPYFPVESTQEILDNLRPFLCPYDNLMNQAIIHMDLFLCTSLPPSEHHRGFKLWFEELLKIWQHWHNMPSWENDLLSLFARLAKDNIGYIDWEPYIPTIFTRLLQSINLPSKTGMVQLLRDVANFNNSTNITTLIVSLLGNGSCCQLYISRFFKALESFYHPSNYGKWVVKMQRLLQRVPFAVVKRLHRERYSKPTWQTPVPEHARLTDQDVTDFVNSILPVTMLAMFSKTGSRDSALALKYLADLRPELVIPRIIEKMYSSLETLTEPHRLIASMHCMRSVFRPLVQSRKHYPEGPTHVIPLLMGILPGIDPNDIMKCMVTGEYIYTLSSLILNVDCSSVVNTRDLPPTVQETCLATAAFEDFVLQLMDRIFVLIENSQLENSNRLDRESERANFEETYLAIMITRTFHAVILHSSPPIFEAALAKLQTFVTSHIFEVNMSGNAAASMCRALCSANPEGLRAFVPHFSKLVLNLTESEDIFNEEKLDDELLFSLQVLSEVVSCEGMHVLKFHDQLVDVLKRSLKLTCKQGHTFACSLLTNLLEIYVDFYDIGTSIVPDPWNRYDADNLHLYLEDWGKSGDIQNLNVKFHQASAEEMSAAKNLLEMFLVPELEKLKSWSLNECTLTREALHRSLNVVVSCLMGASSVLPMWENEENLIIEPSSLPPFRYQALECGYQTIEVNGRNVRQYICEVLRSVLVHVNECCEDDTKALIRIIAIFDSLVHNWGVSRSEYELNWKTYRVDKRTMENRLYGQKKHTRPIIIQRIMLIHQARTRSKYAWHFSATHLLVMKDLLKLSTSHYSNVRKEAQKALRQYTWNSWTCKRILPDILELLKVDPITSHEEFKGVLHVILGQKHFGLLTTRDWEMTCQLYPAIVTSKHSEKPSIIKLLEAISSHIEKNVHTNQIKLKIPDACIEVSKRLWNCSPLPFKPYFNQQEIEKFSEKAALWGETNERHYLTLVNTLVDLAKNGNLHWRHHNLSVYMLLLLIRNDIKMPAAGNELFVSLLVHDTLAVRKLAIEGMACIARQNKRLHPKVEIDPQKQTSADISLHPLVPRTEAPLMENFWLQYNSLNLPDTEEKWNSRYFSHKVCVGFSGWTKPFQVPALDSEQPKVHRNVEDLTEEEKPIYEAFTQQAYVDKLISYCSLEEKKGHDKFDHKKFTMFKSLFSTFGDTFLPQFWDHLDKMVEDRQESVQRCAAEIIAGIFKSSKHWDFHSSLRLREKLQPILEKMLKNVNTETLRDWSKAIQLFAEDRDPNKIYWVIELLIKEPQSIEHGSFLESSWIFLLTKLISQINWKGLEVLHRALDYIIPKLDHSYQNVRERIGSLLVIIFSIDVPMNSGIVEYAPRRKPFLEKLLPRLAILEEKCSGDEKSVSLAEEIPEIKQAKNLFRTICHWIHINARTLYPISPEVIQMLPLLCHLVNDTTDESFHRECRIAIGLMAQINLVPESIEAAIQVLKEITSGTSWRSRKMAASFLQTMVFANLFTLMSNEQWAKDVYDMVLKLLQDENVEVRESAAEALCGFLHCEYFKLTDELLEFFKSKCKKKLQRMSASTSTNGPRTFAPDEVRERHAGILGLCACVNAYPYDVPEFLPDILVLLGDHLHDPQPISTTIKKTLSSFRRTHHDSWRDHKLKFTDDQLAVITDLLVSPSYYA